ncbi:MAG: ROK family protein [candidate division NC10 bacterium]|nr:ROK family protein [candidate division NC10 bacterium]
MCDAARSGDGLAQEALRTLGRYLGIGLASLVNVISPEVIIIGGGLATAGEILLGPACEELSRRAFPILAESTKVVLSALGEEAGAIGAAGLALQSLGFIEGHE